MYTTGPKPEEAMPTSRPNARTPLLILVRGGGITTSLIFIKQNVKSAVAAGCGNVQLPARHNSTNVLGRLLHMQP